MRLTTVIQVKIQVNQGTINLKEFKLLITYSFHLSECVTESRTIVLEIGLVTKPFRWSKLEEKKKVKSAHVFDVS